MHRHVGHHVHRGRQRRPAGEGGGGRLAAVRDDRAPGECDRRDPGPRDRRARRAGHHRSASPRLPPRPTTRTWSATRSPPGPRPASGWTGTRKAAWRGGSPPRCSSRRPSSPGRPERTPRKCEKALQRTLQAGSRARHPQTGRPLFAFRLHQFLSKGDTAYVTLEDESSRHITRDYQVEQPGSDGKVLLPLAFCRECGQEYLVVWRRHRDGEFRYTARRDASVSARRRRRRIPLPLQRHAVAAGPGYRDRRAPPARLLAGGLRPHRAGRGQADGPQVPSGPGDRRRGRPGEARLRRNRGGVPARRRSGSACAAASPTSRSAAGTSPSWRPWTRRAARPRPR